MLNSKNTKKIDVYKFKKNNFHMIKVVLFSYLFIVNSSKDIEFFNLI